MTVYDLANMTWEEVRDLDAGRTIAIVPVGAMEAHGPHLPLATDVIIASAMARSGAGKLAAKGHDVVVLPPIHYTAAAFAASFPGTISLAASSVVAVLFDIARNLAQHGFEYFVVANAHFDPANIASIDQAIATSTRQLDLTVIFPDITKRPWAARLTAEFKSGACHAGQYESSVILAERPELVREEKRRSLPANDTSLSVAIRSGKTNFEEAGGPLAYFGFPADASSEEGRKTIELLGAILEEAVLAEVNRNHTAKQGA